VDSVLEQKKHESNLPWRKVQGKMFENAAESPASIARYVGRFNFLLRLLWFGARWARSHQSGTPRPDRRSGLCHASGELSPQLTAFFTSALILASSVAVNSFSAKAVGHRAPSSRFAVSLKPNVAYLVVNFCALWKKQTTLPSLA